MPARDGRIGGFPAASLYSPLALKRANVDGESGASEPLSLFTNDVTCASPVSALQGGDAAEF
jgi:hypothetical protein